MAAVVAAVAFMRVAKVRQFTGLESRLEVVGSVV